MNVQELEGAELDAAVARALGLECGIEEGELWVRGPTPDYPTRAAWKIEEYSPSQNWHEGGPIIERERIDISSMGEHGWQAAVNPDGAADWSLRWVDGETPLIAAMRAFVASRTPEE